MKYIINKQFETKAPTISPRVVSVAESFGLGIEEQKPFVLYDNVEIEIEQGDVVYITGDSGGGKSVLLKELKRLTNGISPEDVEIIRNKPIIDTLGQSVEEALQLLGLVGLSDAFVSLRYYDELSDGQKSRYMLAKMLESKSQALFIDEFCALLDRETAKIVSYSMQKICRKTNRTLVVATTHNDLVEDLNPSVKITKFFGDSVRVQRIDYVKKQCSLVDQVRIEEGTKEDWLKLAQFHYRSHKINAYSNIYKMMLHDELIGVIVYGYGPIALKARNIATNNIYVKNGKQMNREMRIISRIVIAPKYRGIGLSVKIIKDTMPLVNVRFIEILSVMGVNNPFAQRAGMVDIPYQRDVKGAEKKSNSLLDELGFDHTLMNSTKYNLEKVSLLDFETKTKLFDLLTKVHNMGRGAEQKVFGEKEYDDKYLAWLIKTTRIAHKAYAIWTNPNWVDTYDYSQDESNVSFKEIEKPQQEVKKEETSESILEQIKEKYIASDNSIRHTVLTYLREKNIEKMTPNTPLNILLQVKNLLTFTT